MAVKLKRFFVLILKVSTLYLGFQILHYFYTSIIQLENITKLSQTEMVDMKFSNEEPCFEKRNFVFIKCMKCATETMATIIRRFGLKRVLNFVLPVKNNIYLGWPFIMEKSDYRPSKWSYNIIFEHSIYNESIMSAIMPKDTLYLTIIRHPWSRLVSSYQYFGLDRISEAPTGNFTEYVKNIEKYDKIFGDPRKHRLRGCFPDHFSVVKNLMGHCLGMPLGFPQGRGNITDNKTAIQEYINFIDQKFSLVMIVEYMYESMVLLKRLMCWKLQDIVHKVSNVIGNHHKFTKGDNYKIYEKFSHVDFIIYDHFNASFWKKVRDQGPDFYDEVNHFKLVQLTCNQFCFVEKKTNTQGKFLTIPKSRFNDQFNITSEECKMMDKYLLKDLRKQYDKVEKPKRVEETGEWHEPQRGCSYPIPKH